MNDCVFCKIVAKKEPAEIVYEDLETIAFLDKYPQTRGHLQLVPKEHYRWIYELPNVGQFFVLAQKIIRAIIPVLGADHVTIASFGREVQHAHLWIVPQYGSRESKVSEFERKKSSVEEVSKLLRDALKTV